MKYTPADVIRSLLVASSSLVTMPTDNLPWPAFVSSLPLDPDNVVVLYDQMGRRDGRVMRGGVVIEHPGVQVVVRSIDPTVAADVAIQLATYLDEKVGGEAGNATVTMPDGSEYLVRNVSRYSNVIPLEDKGKLEEDQKRRVRYLFNTNVTLEAL